jgi:hypothetical protein
MVGLGLAVNGYSQSFLTNGLVAYYPFDGNANDASGNGNNGTVYGSAIAWVADRFGVTNQAAAFDGVDNYIDLASLDSFAPTTSQSMTVSFWAKTGIAADVISKYYNLDPAQSDFLVFFDQTDGLIKATGIGTDEVSATWSTNNVWSQFAVVLKSGPSNTMIFQNGQLLVSGTVTYNSILASPDFVIGRVMGPIPGFLNGVVNDIRIYNRALSSNEVQQLYAFEWQPTVIVRKAVSPSFSNLYLGTNYQLQVSSDLTAWTNQGSPFTPTSTVMDYPQYFDVDNWNQLFFRLQVSP